MKVLAFYLCICYNVYVDIVVRKSGYMFPLFRIVSEYFNLICFLNPIEVKMEFGV